MEKKVSMAVMVPLIISHDGAIHKDSVRRWKNFAPDINVDWVRMAQSVLRYNVVIVGKFFNKGSWMTDAWRKEHLEEWEKKMMVLLGGSRQLKREYCYYIKTMVPWALCVCCLLARHLHTMSG